jgi:aminocarboxymuconate-semialdehyde decarboxylase
MNSRRSFMKAGVLGASAVGLSKNIFAAHHELVRPMLDGQPVRTVDIHAHCVFPEVSSVINGTSLAGVNFNPSQVVGARRIEQMNELGLEYQALSVNNYWWYGADRSLSADIVRLHDEGIAAWCNEHPNRFVGLSSVALQHPDLAAEQLEYAVNELGLRGASVGGHVEGVEPTSEFYDPFWAKAEELNVPVFMHPGGADNVIVPDSLDGRGELGNIIGNPLETTIFLTKMIFDGVFDRFPGLRVLGAHGGGYLPSYLGRAEVACQVRGNANCLNTKTPSEYLKTQIFADSMVFSDEGIRHLVAEMGASQVVYGTDLPFNWPDTMQIILEADYLTSEEKRAILGGNLSRLLGIA